MFRIAWDPTYCHPLPEGHRFPMEKYDLLPELLIREGTIEESNLFRPFMQLDEVLMAPHSADYYTRLTNLALSPAEIRKTGFPLSSALILREKLIMSGTVMTAIEALKYGASFNIAGGTHHAFSDRGEGFCLLNDIGIAARYLLDNGLAQQILVIDLDVHQGNGTAEMFGQEPRVFTFSMHGAHNYPLQKEKSDYDIPLPDGTDDGHYLQTLNLNLPRLIDKVQPDFVFYQCGVDILSTDKLGRMQVSRTGCAKRDQIVLELCHRHKIPVAGSLGGGYSANINDILEAHANTFRIAAGLWF
jgi:acetoin utilization deacetylase AcuC-like enzyme